MAVYTHIAAEDMANYVREFGAGELRSAKGIAEGVENSNYLLHAERGLRGAVIYRKLSLGSQSERGERTIERLLSASITCRLRKQSLFHSAPNAHPTTPGIGAAGMAVVLVFRPAGLFPARG